MAITNISDTTFSLIAEAVAGQTPATPAFSVLNYKSGTTANGTSETDESEVVHASRAMVDAFQKNFGSEATLELDLVRSDSMDLLFENALCGSFSANELKAGNVDSTLTIEKKLVSGNTDQYFRYAGSKCSEISIELERDERAMLSASFNGFKKVEKSLSVLTGATYTTETYNRPARGSEISVTIAGQSVSFATCSITIGHDLETVYKLGTEGGFGQSTGKRSGQIEFSVYREGSLAIDTLADGSTPVEITVTIGSGDEGYEITFPAAVSTTPATDTEEGSTSMIDLTFMSTLDATAETDVIITKLA